MPEPYNIILFYFILGKTMNAIRVLMVVSVFMSFVSTIISLFGAMFKKKEYIGLLVTFIISREFICYLISLSFWDQSYRDAAYLMVHGGGRSK